MSKAAAATAARDSEAEAEAVDIVTWRASSPWFWKNTMELLNGGRFVIDDG